jgi:hypothetical protein
MDYTLGLKMLIDSGIMFVGSAAILGIGASVFGVLMWLFIWIGKHLIRYVRKVGQEFKECFTPPEPNGKRVKA